MTLNLGELKIAQCVNVPPGPDARCDDPAFSLANPDLCPQEQRFIIKPGIAIVCSLGSVAFSAFIVENGVERDVTTDTAFSTSDPSILVITANTGLATGMTPGEAVVTAKYQDVTAQSPVTVLAGSKCCDDETVAIMVMVDQTHSMSQTFPDYSTKLGYAKTAAIALIDSVNEQKDKVGLMRFTKDAQVVLSVPTADKGTVAALVPGIAQTQVKTEFYEALATGIATLDLTDADRKVLVLFTDGEDMAASYTTKNPLQLASDFKAAGGIVFCVGARAHGSGYNFLSALATGGFFINAHKDTAAQTLGYMIGLKGYICGGNCVEVGDVNDYRGNLCHKSLNYWDILDPQNKFGLPNNPGAGFIAAEIYPTIADIQRGSLYVTEGLKPGVDLIGNGFFDYLPLNGLYVDLLSECQDGTTPQPMLMTKDAFQLTQGTWYKVRIKVAGPQIIADDGNYVAPSVVVGLVSCDSGDYVLLESVKIQDYKQDFTNYTFTFQAPATELVKLTVHQDAIWVGSETSDNQLHGILLKEVELREVTGVPLFFDNFNTENPTYVGPKCGQGTVWTVIGQYDSEGQTFLDYGYMAGYDCYGDGCLDTPPIAQSQDPKPLPNLEAGTGGGIFYSTQTACAPACPKDHVNIGQPLSFTTPAGGEVYETRIRLSAAAAIKFWKVKFKRDWSEALESNPVPLTLQGSNNGTVWTEIDTQPQVTGGIAELELFYVLAAETTPYTYYQANLGPGTPSGTAKVLGLEVYAAPPDPVCKTATAVGATPSQAISNALQAAINASVAQQHCLRVYTATEVYQADDGTTQSAVGSSLNSEAEAQAIAAAKAATAA
jgi:Mg-chelatase subunit ChlD